MEPQGASNLHILMKALGRQMEKGSSVLSSRQVQRFRRMSSFDHEPRKQNLCVSDNAVCKILTLNSSKLKPLPARTLVWYLTVGHLTMGRIGPDAGRGAMRRAFACRALRLSKQKPSGSYCTPRPTSPLRRVIYCLMPQREGGHRGQRAPTPKHITMSAPWS